MIKFIPLLLAGAMAVSCDALMEENKDTNNVNKPQNVDKDKLLAVNDFPIVFYNVENLFDIYDDPKTSDDDFTPKGYKEWDAKRYNKKLDDLAKVLSTINGNLPLAIGLAEIENQQVIEDLMVNQRLRDAQYSIVHEESPDARGIDVAFVYDRNRFFYESHHMIRIDFPWDDNIKTRDIMHVKGTLYNGEVLHFFVNHWPSRRDGKEETEPKRLEVAGRLRDYIDKLRDSENYPKIIVMGDFNDTPTDKSVRDVLGASVSIGTGSGELFNLTYAESTKLGGGSHAHEGHWQMLDQLICSYSLLHRRGSKRQGILVKNNTAFVHDPDWILFEKKNGDVVPNKTYGGSKYYGGYSDHLPVVLILNDAQ